VVRVARSAVIDAPVEDVWRLLRDFNGHGTWHPAVAESAIEAGEPADLVGCVRAFALRDGAVLREQLVALSDRERSLTYCILDAPLPLADYVATLRLSPVTDGDRTFAHWHASFTPPPAQAESLTRLVAEDIYEAGLAALVVRFARPAAYSGSASAPSSRRRPESMAPPALASGWVPAFAGATTEDLAPIAAVRPMERTGAGVATDAIVVEAAGGPEVLVLRRIAVPPPNPGEVRLRHTAIGVNMIDLRCRAGTSPLMPLPGVPGVEGAGVVTAVGEGVTDLAPGDRVVYAGGRTGSYSGIRVVPADRMVRLPDDVAGETAASVFLKGLMADILVNQIHPVGPGQAVLVHSAAGGTGLLIASWARALGAEVVGTVSTMDKAAAAEAAGCHRVIVRPQEDVAAAVDRLTGGRGVDVVFDPLGGETFDASLRSLARPGHLVSFGQAGGPLGSHDLGRILSGSRTLSRPDFADYTATRERLLPMAGRLFAALGAGMLKPPRPTMLPLADAATAHRLLESRSTVGAFVLVPQS
jgi:NADPH2:quinone reductase